MFSTCRNGWVPRFGDFGALVTDGMAMDVRLLVALELII